MKTKLLTSQDAVIYKELRLQALQNNPESYLSTFDHEKQKTIEAFASELRYASGPPVFGYYGIFDNDKLIGYAHLEKSYLTKQKHIAFFYNLYIDPEYRNKGLATELFDFLLAELKQKTQIERIFLSCNKKNTSAISLYKKLGFVEYGIKKKSIKYQNEYDDEIEMVREV